MILNAEGGPEGFSCREGASLVSPARNCLSQREGDIQDSEGCILGRYRVYQSAHFNQLESAQVEGIYNCISYQLLSVQHSCSSTQSWGSVLPSIVEMTDQNSRGCPILFSNRNSDLFVHRGQKSYTPTAFGKLWTTPGVRCIKHAMTPV